MTLDIRRFVDRPGHRFPLQVTLPGTGEPDDELRTVEKITLDGQVFVQLSTLYLAVRISAPVTQPCRRCLTPVTTVVELDEEFEVPIEPGQDDIDLWPDAVRLVLSAHDPNVLCRPTCRGLCPTCGADLNREPDHRCQAEDDEPRTLRHLFSWPDGS
jgi:uncharacterized metal-binding protein YceD (DUF177 family)